jgi:hypothetical protein
LGEAKRVVDISAFTIQGDNFIRKDFHGSYRGKTAFPQDVEYEDRRCMVEG